MSKFQCLNLVIHYTSTSTKPTTVASSTPGTASKNYTMEKSFSDALVGSAPKVEICFALKELRQCVPGDGGEEWRKGRGEKETRKQIQPFPAAEKYARGEKYAGGEEYAGGQG